MHGYSFDELNPVITQNTIFPTGGCTTDQLKSITIMIIEDNKQAELMTSALQTKV